MPMTPRERVMAALRGEWADQVPFTSYENKFFYSQAERELRNAGMCIIDKRVPVYRQVNPAVSQEWIHQPGAAGNNLVRHIVRTEAGVISELTEQSPNDPRVPSGLLPWHREYFFKGPVDYPPLMAMIRGRRYVDNYDAFGRAQEQAGGDLVMLAALGYSPLQEIIYKVMGIEQFAIEWAERREALMELYEALVADRRMSYPLVAGSPAVIVNYCGNVSPEVVGLERFEAYILPHYNELADMLHEEGKLIGVHFDANCRLLAQAIAGSRIDYVEAFTPAPNSDMSVSEARSVWPDKALWINFPSATHLAPPVEIEGATRAILRQAAPGDRFLIGVTETVPMDTWQRSFGAITRVLQEDGRLPLRVS